ncbi:hypothetical protein [Nocardia lasii]|uniref:Uncharacterized protein n=1 Tax=Nocardia lasii TaxID=1616107 RepID=A0ABW1JYS9_9NOCA
MVGSTAGVGSRSNAPVVARGRLAERFAASFFAMASAPVRNCARNPDESRTKHLS